MSKSSTAMPCSSYERRKSSNFMSAVIDRRAFDKISGYLALAKKTAKVLQGGRADDRTGFFVEPTLVQTKTPDHRLMVEEIFGPVVTAYVFPDRQWAQTLRLIDRSTPYALTGAVFARDRHAVREAASSLRNADMKPLATAKHDRALSAREPESTKRLVAFSFRAKPSPASHTRPPMTLSRSLKSSNSEGATRKSPQTSSAKSPSASAFFAKSD